MPEENPGWAAGVEEAVSRFSRDFGLEYRVTKRSLSASFEIGCFLFVKRYYENLGCRLRVMNLMDGHYRYLTSPSGNPDNFSYVAVSSGKKRFEIRQQVRVVSRFHEDVAFAPDIVILKTGATITARRDADFAGGKRNRYGVSSHDVIAAHECKSLPPFPELLVSFLGCYSCAHDWSATADDWIKYAVNRLHLAPTLFVGGGGNQMHVRMAAAMKEKFVMNVVLGIHEKQTTLGEPRTIGPGRKRC